MKTIKPNTKNDWLVVVNPNAGQRKGQKDWARIAQLLEEANFSFVSVFTQRKYQAIKLTTKYIELSYKKIIVVGGDGTLNEVVNGVLNQKKFDPTEIAIGMIPVGTGNDWCKMYDVPQDYKQAITVISHGHSLLQDAAMVEYFDGAMPRKRALINMAGMGYDALVAKKTNAQKERGISNSLSYMYNLFTGLFSWMSVETKVVVDDQEEISCKVFSMNVGVNMFNGNGMKQLPFANPTDGLLDMTIIRKVGKFLILRSVNKLFDGSFVEMPQVSTHLGKKISIHPKNPEKISLEIDGESVGSAPITISSIAEAVRLIVPPGAQSYYRKAAKVKSVRS